MYQVQIHSSMVYFIILELDPINISLLPTETMLGFVNRGHQRDTRRQQQHEGNSHQGSSPPFLNSGWYPSDPQRPGTLKPCSPNLTTLASFFAIGHSVCSWTAINNEVGERLQHKFFKFLHYLLFLNLEVAAFFAPITSGPLQARFANIVLRPDSKCFSLSEPYSLCQIQFCFQSIKVDMDIS